MPRPAAHACAVGVPQHPHRVACLQSRPHPLLLAQRDHQRLDVHRPARVHAVLRPHPGAPRPVLHQGVWYDWAPLLAVRRDNKQRFSLLEEDGELLIRANQGHTLKKYSLEVTSM
ncbi:Serine/arginine-rich splicing factor SR45a [Zea mays]|nr:Serine/arginine-rich splicing factor SR45a [Zea mays]